MVRKPYRRVFRLCLILADRYPLIEAEYYQTDLLSLRPRKLLNLVYTWLIAHVNPEKLDEVIAELDDLLPWEDVGLGADLSGGAGSAAERAESESFYNMMGKQPRK